MNHYVRVVEGVVVEAIDLPANLGPEAYFVPSMAAAFIAAPPMVKDHWKYKDDKFTPPDQPSPPPLNVVKKLYKSEVDTAAETERLNYITPGTGQAMTYQQKVAEAQAFKAASNPKPVDYPILASEAGITAPTLSEVADTVLNAYYQWQQIGAMIEAIRLGAKRDIDASTTEAAAREIVEAIIWPSAQMK